MHFYIDPKKIFVRGVVRGMFFEYFFTKTMSRGGSKLALRQHFKEATHLDGDRVDVLIVTHVIMVYRSTVEQEGVCTNLNV